MNVETFPGGSRTHALGSATKAVRVAQCGDFAGPDGMQYLDSGAFKTAFTDGRFVYKTGNNKDGGGVEYANETLRAEFREYQRLYKEGVPWLAPTSMYVIDGVPVLVQPKYQRRTNHELTPRQRAHVRAAQSELTDMYEGNWLATKRGQVRVIDLGGHDLA